VNRRLLVRAVSLLHPAELPSLRVIDAEVFDAVASALRLDDGTTALVTDAPPDASKDAAPAPSRVLDSLQALKTVQRVGLCEALCEDSEGTRLSSWQDRRRLERRPFPLHAPGVFVIR
jgi:hypothetical protein